MSLPSWWTLLQRRTKRRTGARRQAPRQQRKCDRPQIERLEDRAVPAGGSYRDLVGSANPSAYWQLDELNVGPGAALDAIAGHHGTLVNLVNGDLGQASALAQGDGTAVRFNGVNQFVQLPADIFGNYPTSGATSDYVRSFSVWFRTTSSGVILGQASEPATPGSAAPGGWVGALYVGIDGRVRSSLFWPGDIMPLVSPGTYNDGEWHHAAVVHNQGAEALFLDGVQVASRSSGVAVGYGPSYEYYLGTGYTQLWPAANGGWHFFNGQLDEAAVFAQALTAEQVLAQYQAGVALPATNPVVTAAANQTAQQNALTFIDLGSFTDRAADGPWTVEINWGDKSPVTSLTATAAGVLAPTAHTFARKGNFQVTVKVTDQGGAVGTASFRVNVSHGAPTAHVQGPSAGVRGQELAFQLTADDPSAADEAAGFTYRVSWGDGSAAQVIARSTANGDGVLVSHTYKKAGTFTVKVTATDVNGVVSTTVKQTVEVKGWGVQLQADPVNPGQTMRVLVVGGTTGDDTVLVTPGESGEGLKLQLKEGELGSWQEYAVSTVDRVVVYGQAGHDWIEVSDNVTLPVELYGGDGADFLKAGGGNSLLVGGRGQDSLIGGRGRSVLIGGRGKDNVQGRGDDLLIGGSTVFDADAHALRAIFGEWSSDVDYATRVAHLQGAPGGLNEGYFLNESTVVDDLRFDVLTSFGGQDWFISGRRDRVTGQNYDPGSGGGGEGNPPPE